MVRVSLFQFQDIITCVSGILIMITLLLTTMLGENQGSPSKTAASLDLDGLSKTLSALKEANVTLKKNVGETLDPDQVLKDTEILRSQLGDLSTKLNGIEGAGVKIKKGETDVGMVEKQIAEQTEKNKELEKEIKDKQDKLVENANTWWLVPKLSANSKMPVLVVVSETTVTVDEFNKPQGRMNLDGAKAGDAFAELMRKYNPAAQYVVFYVKPSGIPNFVTLKEQARKAGFQVGFDAMLETVTLNFFKPSN